MDEINTIFLASVMIIVPTLVFFAPMIIRKIHGEDKIKEMGSN